jgi:hypothetical protein
MALAKHPAVRHFILRIRGPINHGRVVRDAGGARAQRVRNFPIVRVRTLLAPSALLVASAPGLLREISAHVTSPRRAGRGFSLHFRHVFNTRSLLATRWSSDGVQAPGAPSSSRAASAFLNVRSFRAPPPRRWGSFLFVRIRDHAKAADNVRRHFSAEPQARSRGRVKHPRHGVGQFGPSGHVLAQRGSWADRTPPEVRRRACGSRRATDRQQDDRGVMGGVTEPRCRNSKFTARGIITSFRCLRVLTSGGYAGKSHRTI